MREGIAALLENRVNRRSLISEHRRFLKAQVVVRQQEKRYDRLNTDAAWADLQQAIADRRLAGAELDRAMGAR